jgi:hypothetical protein
LHLAPEDDELLPKCRVLGFKPALGLEDRDHQVQGQEDQSNRRHQRELILSPM